MAIWQTVAGATVILTFISALLVRWTDPETIRTFGDGMWWAAQTVTTVGYGDIVLESAPGRAVGALVMFMGIAFITSTTAVMGTVFAESTRRRRGAVDRGGELRADPLPARRDHPGARGVAGGARRPRGRGGSARGPGGPLTCRGPSPAAGAMCG